ncbi:MAG: hypothetical protein RL605_254 [Actinomycetota bacterium]|jgi:proteasome accessory factor C
MPKLNGFDNTDRFNLTVSLIAYLERQARDVTFDEAAEHFKCTRNDIAKAARDINRIAPDVGGMETGMALLDLDELEAGVLSMLQADYLTEVPRISMRQAAAVAAGLSYLGSMPGFEGDPDIAELLELLAGESDSSVLAVRETTVDPDVEIIRKALLTGQAIECEYVNQRGERTVRELDPLRLDPRPDNWYLRAWCPKSLESKTFRLDRMKNSRLIERPISAEARTAAATEDSLYVAKETDTEVLVEVDPEAYRLIAESVDVETLASNGKNAGTVRATIRVGYLPNIGHLIARYGGAARVIAPEAAKKYALDYALMALGQAATAADVEVE